MVIVFLWALNTSLKTADNFSRDPVGITRAFAFENYIKVFNSIKYTVNIPGKGIYTRYYESMLLYSVLYACGSALFSAFCTAVVAYCTARYNNIVAKILHYTVIVTLISPIVGNLPSLLQIVQKLHLYDTMWGAWIMKFGFNNMYYLILYAFFRQLSWEYAESAFLDGASHFSVFFRIMLPLAMMLVGTVFLLQFITFWNDYQTPLLFLPTYRTAAVGLFVVYGMTEGDMAYPTIKIAGSVFIFLPILVVFVFFRNKIMGNLTEGGIKA